MLTTKGVFPVKSYTLYMYMYIYILPLPQIDLMDHPLYTISYVADVENMLVIMINRIMPPLPSPENSTGGHLAGGGEGEKEEGQGRDNGEEVAGGDKNEGDKEREDSVQEDEGEEGYNGIHVGPIPRMTCHVLETNDVSTCTCMYMVG